MTIQRNIKLVLLALALVGFFACKGDDDTTGGDDNGPGTIETGATIDFWLTRANKSALFEKQTDLLQFSTASNANTVSITVNPSSTYQEIDGFGFALTGGSAQMINQLNDANKEAILNDLFLTEGTSIGVSYLRISLGASDLNDEPFTYDETPDGSPDEQLTNFTLEKDQVDVIPVLKRIVQLNPGIKILASPWTPPTWMKTNKSFIGGELEKQYYDVYARYFVKYIKAMAAEGITIDAITVQNEPWYAYNNPSMYMAPEDQAEFIKTALGPQFEANNIKTKIIIWDHNLDGVYYPLTVLSDPDAYKYIDGSAFHAYGGDISSMSTVYAQYPEKNLYFTEQWTSSEGSFSGDLQWHISQLIIGATRNWSRNVIEWNLASNAEFEPHTDGGCSQCQGALTITGNSITKNVSYYIIAHAAKFVRPGSVRIASDTGDQIKTVAFLRPDGKKVLVALNASSSSIRFNIKYDGKTASPLLSAGAVGTFVWD